jgi:hypothetical protein
VGRLRGFDFAGTREECRNFQPILDFMLGLKVPDEFGFRHGGVDIKYFVKRQRLKTCSLPKQPNHQDLLQRTIGQKQKDIAKLITLQNEFMV